MDETQVHVPVTIEELTYRTDQRNSGYAVVRSTLTGEIFGLPRKKESIHIVSHAAFLNLCETWIDTALAPYIPGPPRRTPFYAQLVNNGARLALMTALTTKSLAMYLPKSNTPYFPALFFTNTYDESHPPTLYIGWYKTESQFLATRVCRHLNTPTQAGITDTIQELTPITFEELMIDMWPSAWGKYIKAWETQDRRSIPILQNQLEKTFHNTLRIPWSKQFEEGLGTLLAGVPEGTRTLGHIASAVAYLLCTQGCKIERIMRVGQYLLA